MTENSDLVEVINLCSQFASIGPDGQWNRLFVSHLKVQGYVLTPDPGNGHRMMAPFPVATEEWVYPYPSYIVKRQW